jgi:Domain of unknown function (DUF4386)
MILSPRFSISNPGRVAGLWYLLLIIIGPLRLVYIPDKLFTYDNPAATVNNIAAHELLFRLGIVANLAGALVLVFLTLALYRLFVGVNRNLATEVVIFGGVMPAVIYFVDVVSDFGALVVAQGGANFLSAFDKPQQDVLAVLLLRLRDGEETAALILAGVWLFPLAIPVCRSHFLPRFLGVWLILAGVGWLVLSLKGLLLPHYWLNLFALLQPVFFGEIALALWLVLKGASPQTLHTAAT